MPAPVRSAIEDRLGSRVVSARSQAGGFSPGVAARLQLADGARVFVKAVCGSPNPESPLIHRREARISAALPAHVPAPALRWSWDDGDWVVLAFVDVDARPPELPWRTHELERVLAALHALATGLTPSPISLEPATKSLARLWGPHGVRVNAVAPGYVRTRLTAFRWQDAAESRAVLARTPLARWGEAEDIVGPTLFLCSREAGFITGVVLPVDGGYLTIRIETCCGPARCRPRGRI